MVVCKILFHRWIYHTLANNESLKGDIHNPHNQLSKSWWWLAFRYFENQVPCHLPLEFGWPIPKKLMKWRPSSFRQSSSRQLTNVQEAEELNEASGITDNHS